MKTNSVKSYRERLEKVLLENMSELEKSGYVSGKVENIEVNAPLALMQVEHRARFYTFKKILDIVKEIK